MAEEQNLARGVMAGMIGGLVASWVMNEFMAGPGKKLKAAIQSDEQNWCDEVDEVEAQEHPREDATMKAADAIVNTATGGRHLSWEGKQKGGPVVHYAFGALMGGVYGGLTECNLAVSAGFGTIFGAALFGGADMVAVPALELAPRDSARISPALVPPLAAHIVYGATTELVRRIVREVL
ncbi:hypothetical protein ACFPT7_19960 [Acidicapsa dinghuensis]|uniref:DUF1440 domain-containing protein n=1 Tax=Acidicapsa dinghuensis TaxID=2218256 RepID=A0ABW1EKS6_9BACT|nr:hypothetical protein [Acidicapsa dinghuensis]